MTISDQIKAFIQAQDCPIVGFADLRGLPGAIRQNFDFGIVMGLPHSRKAMHENAAGQMDRYYAEFVELNERLPQLANATADFIYAQGYRAWAKNKNNVVLDDDLRTILPHKTVATLAGLGWIGKSAVLITPQAGAALRLTVVLTNAPLDCGSPITQTKCPEDCMICTDICPGHAPSGKLWRSDCDRADFYDAHACSAAAKARTRELIGVDESVCGLCIANCPFTRKALYY